MKITQKKNFGMPENYLATVFADLGPTILSADVFSGKDGMYSKFSLGGKDYDLDISVLEEAARAISAKIDSIPDRDERFVFPQPDDLPIRVKIDDPY